MRFGKSEIKEGKGYVTRNGTIIRVVYAIKGDTVLYRAYGTDSGQYFESRSCTLDNFIEKVTREATPDESSRVAFRTAEKAEHNEFKETVELALSYATSEQLWAELRRRGEVD